MGKEYGIRELFKQPLWTKIKSAAPFWEVLKIAEWPVEDSRMELLGSLSDLCETLLDFLEQVVQYANNEFEVLQKGKDAFPDTVLLRTFTRLLHYQQESLNGFAQKHLDFYFQDILMQTPEEAVPDRVFINLVLSKDSKGLLLAEGTLFSAGVDSNKQPIQFETLKKESLVPGSITNAYSLSASNLGHPNGLQALFFKQVANPSKIPDSSAKTLPSWSPFGASNDPDAVRESLGFAFASPYLFLQEGQRTVTVTFYFQGQTDLSFLDGAQMYLSSSGGWVSITEFLQDPPIFSKTKANQVALTFFLDARIPSIVPLGKAEEGMQSNWPIFKMVFWQFTPIDSPPILSKVTIETDVDAIKNFQLYNDFGLLSTKVPFELFGPTPSNQANFIMGSQEIFSKNISSLKLDFTWDQLPANFQNYYQAYNNYVQDPNDHQNKPVKNEKGIFNLMIIKKLCNAIGTIPKFFQKLFSSIPETPNTPFNNVCFSVDFSCLNQGNWVPFSGLKKSNGTFSESSEQYEPYPADAGCKPSANDSSVLLFSTETSSVKTLSKGKTFSVQQSCQNTLSSCFAYPIDPNEAPMPSDVSIQNKPLKYTDNSQSGFMKMTLTNPSEGFGSSIYPYVVSDVAIHNAKIISSSKPDYSKIAPPPSKPFVPKVKLLTASYSASVSYDFTDAASLEGLDFFYLTPFRVFKVPDPSKECDISLAPISGKGLPSNGLPLWTPFPTQGGAMYLQCADLPTTGQLTFFMQLAKKWAASIPNLDDLKVSYAYANATSWEQLTVRNDTTSALQCSGLVEVELPGNLSESSLVMPQGNQWICVTTLSSPDSYPGVAYLATNGMQVQRANYVMNSDQTVPQIAAQAITGLVVPNKGIAKVIQPFVSWGGKALENKTSMNHRTSNRIKNKGRAITKADYYTMIKENFNQVYYSKASFNSEENVVELCVVPSVESAKIPEAFTPSISYCDALQIANFFSENTPMGTAVKVSNFSFIPVEIQVEVKLQDGFGTVAMAALISDSLKLYLSPWILSGTDQLAIDTGISVPQLRGFVSKIKGVAEVVHIQILVHPETQTLKTNVLEAFLRIPNENFKLKNNQLLVSAAKHTVTFYE